MAKGLLANSREIERMRAMLRDVARLDLVGAKKALDEAEEGARSAAVQLSDALGWWQDAFRRHKPDPAIFGLAGAAVIAAEAKQKAALLDTKIVRQRCDEAAGLLAEAEARLEGAQTMRGRIQRDCDRRAEEHLAREVEDAFIRRSRA